MAVKIVRQEKSIVLLGVPTSAAALAAGRERAPAKLRAAGLAAKLTEAGFTVADHGDCTTRVFQADDEHPRARNVRQVLSTLEELRPKVEVAVKSGALPVVLGGDTSIVLATIAGARRYYRNVSLIFLDRNADLKEPATTASGSVDGMVISHVLGRGAPELVRFWGEPPLVRAPDLALFGIGEPDEAEQKFMESSPLRRYPASDVARLGGRAAAEAALADVHGRTREFVLHVDLNVIAAQDFVAANSGAAGEAGAGGLPLRDVRQALAVFARQPTMVALEISSYNPALDADGESAKAVVELLVEILSARLGPEEEAVPPSPGARESIREDSPAPSNVGDVLSGVSVDAHAAAEPKSEYDRPVEVPVAAGGEKIENTLVPEAAEETPSLDQASAGSENAGAGAAGSGNSAGVERPQENTPDEHVSIESPVSGTAGDNNSAVEIPHESVERESPGERVSDVAPDSAPSRSSGSDGSVERETP